MVAVRVMARRIGTVALVGAAAAAAMLPAMNGAGAAVTVVRHTLPVVDQGVQPTNIAMGSDNNLWFTYSFRQAVGRITPSGVVTDFPIPTANADSDGITAGPDGALWFTEFQANKIARVTTSGSVTEYALPSGGSPQFITAGPDGAVWFTEESARRIGRISTAGAITEFAIPGPGRGAEDIATGSDGNLWFTDPANARVGKLTTGGVVSYVTIPHTGPLTVSPAQIAAGPDGALWVADDQKTIDRVTVGGAVTEFADAAAFGGAITAGPERRALGFERQQRGAARRSPRVW